MKFDVPILFIIYNRVDTTAKVFENIREIKPQRLFIAADGPREKEGENEKCQLVRKLVLENIDWPCEIKTLFRDNNLGCASAVSGAITWFFENVEEGIILEDDVFPHKNFYYYCEEMLNKYRNDERIRFINGCNFGYKRIHGKSYGFTRFMNMWGWASWRRSVNIVDGDMTAWKTLQDKNKFLEGVVAEQSPNTKKVFIEYFQPLFDDITSSKIESWDYPYIFSNFLTRTFCIFPSRNLIQNLGFNNDGTHTNFDSYFISDLKTGALVFPLVENPDIRVDKNYEKFVLERWAHLKVRNRLYYSIQYRLYKLKRILGA